MKYAIFTPPDKIKCNYSKEYINRSPSQIPIWEGMFQKSFTLHYENHISSELYWKKHSLLESFLTKCNLVRSVIVIINKDS
jgi:hypothetical protein